VYRLTGRRWQNHIGETYMGPVRRGGRVAHIIRCARFATTKQIDRETTWGTADIWGSQRSIIETLISAVVR